MDADLSDDRLLAFGRVIGAGTFRIEDIAAFAFADFDVGGVGPVVAFAVTDIEELPGFGVSDIGAVGVIRIVKVQIPVLVVALAFADPFVAAGDLHKLVMFAAQNFFDQKDFAAGRKVAGDGGRAVVPAAFDPDVAVNDRVALHIVREQASADEVPDDGVPAELRRDDSLIRRAASDRAEPGTDVSVDRHAVQADLDRAGDLGGPPVGGERLIRLVGASRGDARRDDFRGGFVDAAAVAAAVHGVEAAAAGEVDPDVAVEQGVPDAGGVENRLSVLVIHLIAVFVEARFHDLRRAAAAADQPVGDFIAAGHGELDIALVPDADAGAVDDLSGCFAAAGRVVEMERDIPDDFDVPAAARNRQEGAPVDLQVHGFKSVVAVPDRDDLVEFCFRAAAPVDVHWQPFPV